ncbi:MAG: hypothetical protein U9Q79_02940 [Candidatus Hydrogenedentes bacterium]|nr:hypothetical protein [Candidatus Hydrogenedentota bacterium]
MNSKRQDSYVFRRLAKAFKSMLGNRHEDTGDREDEMAEILHIAKSYMNNMAIGRGIDIIAAPVVGRVEIVDPFMFDHMRVGRTDGVDDWIRIRPRCFVPCFRRRIDDWNKKQTGRKEGAYYHGFLFLDRHNVFQIQACEGSRTSFGQIPGTGTLQSLLPRR